MLNYLIAYRFHGNDELFFYRFSADDAKHALEQFLNDGAILSEVTRDSIIVVFITPVI